MQFIAAPVTKNGGGAAVGGAAQLMVRAACGENPSMVHLAPVRAAAGGANEKISRSVAIGCMFLLSIISYLFSNNKFGDIFISHGNRENKKQREAYNCC
jgi:hypothetical protein